MPAAAADAQRPGLFWRTYFLIGSLIVASVFSSLQLVQVFDQSPPDQQLAWEIASVINLTRSALVNTSGARRMALLSEFARHEGVRVTPREPGDRIDPIDHDNSARAKLARNVQTRLEALVGHPTVIAGTVNGERALWVSFQIDGDDYWLVLDRERFDRQTGPHWATIALIVLALSGLGALAVSRRINRPLARLADALERLSRGQPPPSLPESGAPEIALLNRRFNRMTRELAALESDRALALAGISHDIRTPLARLRLEIELSPLPAQTRDSMAEEIEHIDAIVGRFVEYGRASGGVAGDQIQAVDLEEILHDLQSRHRHRLNQGSLRLTLECSEDAHWRGDALDLTRILDNLIENSLRYGKTPTSGCADVHVQLTRAHDLLTLSVTDAGPGIASDQAQRLMKPFTRADKARGSAHAGEDPTARAGTGLGLAIVTRIAQRYGGGCELASRLDGGAGLQVRVWLHDAQPHARRDTRLPLADA